MTQYSCHILEVISEKSKISLSLYMQGSTVHQYEDANFSFQEINSLCEEVTSLLNKANKKGEFSSGVCPELKKVGQVLYDQLLTNEIKYRLKNTKVDNLLVLIDEGLVQVPWELLYDGSQFLCLRFNMGRNVKTRQTLRESSERTMGSPVKMLILADPTNDLKFARQEATLIEKELDKKRKIINVAKKVTNIDTQYLKRNLRDYDVVHFAGHADYDFRDSSNSGWKLIDGRFTANDIVNMGTSTPLPSVVFSNSCRSAQTSEWLVDKDFENKIFGLANAFLLAGVRHYIGTFWEITDDFSLNFAKEFYYQVLQGCSIGEAVRRARLKIIKDYGEKTIVWSSYILYGDPTFSLFAGGHKKPSLLDVKISYLQRIIVVSLVVLSLFALVIWQIHPKDVSVAIQKIDNLNTGEHDEVLANEVSSKLKNLDMGNLHIKDLKILLSPNESMNISLRNICKKFRISSLVVGEYRENDSGIFGKVRFINPADGELLQSKDIIANDFLDFAEQATVAIMDMAKVKISKIDKVTITKKPTENLEAYLIFRKTWKLFLEGKNLEVIELCNQALSLDKNYVDVYKRLADVYDRLGKRDVAIDYCFKYRDISEQKQDWANLANAYLKIGKLKEDRDLYSEALDYFNKALSLANKNALRLEGAKAYSRIGSLHEANSKYDLALECFFKAMVINKKFVNIYSHEYELAGNYKDVGLVYLDKEDYDKSLENTMKGLEIYKETGDLNGMAKCYTNIGEVYRYKGLPERAIEYYNLGLELDMALGAYYESGTDYNVLGEIYYGRKDYDKAIEYFQKALDIRRRAGGGISVSETLANFGKVYYDKGDLAKAIAYLKEALDIGREIGKKRCMFDYAEAQDLLTKAEEEFSNKRE